MDIAEIAKRARQFKPVFVQHQAAAAPREFPWYPYDSAANFDVFDRLLKGPPRRLLELAGAGIVADVGGADGFTAFFLETLGCKVDLVDHGPTNFNGLRGARLLKDALRSAIEIHEVDLDQQFSLPRAHYGLVLFLGILYHLKNPYYALEALARSSRYCLLSTRVARFAPQGVVLPLLGRVQTKIEDLPVAYLVDPYETNNDSTNYWIFSVAGLRRLIARAGWEILEFMTIGDTRKSDPASQEHDERAFCLLESRRA
jgi:SAM-dependent methyltransferase